ncbi:immunity 49 family protein (plasmid) [Pseudoalteromonas piscicida]|uniref:Uncharacterized protein n=1 Tax=Pseudoalteromonas piscicida TaxID=43662 RepID=A0ABN5CHW1_PSEO7|nr:immunity 49 family protein [Pseudoalteromonas piscicida]ATD09182.1 hypothetical protein PPIS_a4577 [Pseudoalteromonas piscicida]ATD09815.1 hypothetical protein PPIS_b0705 [Pseudoalteromonas piscicida]UDM64205.1 immunity 49 family protein [Pseudoalteromonas piscicida]WPU31142.1 immunity 49 family protein [Pseudoalteromonas piscicida]WPU31705.1 immunity 49 family protein [Pseudoalteromonas piscicida]
MVKNHYSYAKRTYDRANKLYEKSNSIFLETLQKNGCHTLSTFASLNLEEMFPLEVLESPGSDKAWHYIARALQLKLAIFQFNESPDSIFKFAYDNEVIELSGQLSPQYANIFNWQKALFCAIITRNQTAIDYLITVDNSVFKSAKYSEQLLPFDFAYVDLLKAIFTPSADLNQAIEKALIASDPNDCSEDDVYLYSSRLEWPIVSVILGIFTDDSGTEYNQAVESASALHNEYYNTDDRRYSLDGAISIPLTAMASLAKDIKGYDLTTENGYIPDWLVNPNPPK